jgi:hypothetical protein
VVACTASFAVASVDTVATYAVDLTVMVAIADTVHKRPRGTIVDRTSTHNATIMHYSCLSILHAILAILRAILATFVGIKRRIRM